MGVYVLAAEKTEALLIKRFSRDLEFLGEMDEKEIDRLADEEYRELVRLAKKLKGADFSKGSKAREELKKKLMSTLKQNSRQQSDLSHEELDHVAGGIKTEEDHPFRDN